MKKGLIISICAALAISVIPSISFAEGGGRQQRGKEAIFTLMDANADGKLSYEEYQSAAKRFLNKRRSGFMEQMDVDQDNAISVNEFKHWHENIMSKHKGGKHGDKKGKRSGMSQEQMAKAEKRWQKMDLNQDGVIEKAEMYQVITDKVNKMFEHKDKNKDGIISKDEMRPPTIEDRFAKHDINGDGKIDQSEMDSLRDERTKKRFGKKDANNDGYIDINEFGKGGPGGHRRDGKDRMEGGMNGQHRKGMERY